jgi:hypothetical protein
LPLVTSLIVAGPSVAGVLVAVSAIAAFLAHEPASVLLGMRGARARQERRGTAVKWLVWTLAIGVIAGASAFLVIHPGTRSSLAVPIVPAVLLGAETVRGREKSWHGEVAAALAFAGLAVPIAMAGGASLTIGMTVAAPFALLFVTGTLAVRTAILRVRGGGNPQAVRAAQRSVFAAAVGGTVGLAWLASADVLPAATIAAASPGLLIAVVIAARPPRPARLRTIGWTFVAVSVLTAAIVIATV